jgi:hypothetical protein
MQGRVAAKTGPGCRRREGEVSHGHAGLPQHDNDLRVVISIRDMRVGVGWLELADADEVDSCEGQGKASSEEQDANAGLEGGLAEEGHDISDGHGRPGQEVDLHYLARVVMLEHLVHVLLDRFGAE